MNAHEDVRVVPRDGHHKANGHRSSSSIPSQRRYAAPLRSAIMRTRQWLLGAQDRDGFWCGELEGDTILES